MQFGKFCNLCIIMQIFLKMKNKGVKGVVKIQSTTDILQVCSLVCYTNLGYPVY